MFDIGWSELLIIGIVALIAIGPKELPSVLRTVGQYMAKIRRMASEFQGQFQEAMREAEMADLKKEVDEMAEAASEFTDFNPLDDVQKEIESAVEDKPHEGAAAADGTAAATDSASLEAAGPAAPAPVSSDVSVPQPASEGAASDAGLAAVPEAPRSKSQPDKTGPSNDEAKTGSGP